MRCMEMGRRLAALAALAAAVVAVLWVSPAGAH